MFHDVNVHWIKNRHGQFTNSLLQFTLVTIGKLFSQDNEISHNEQKTPKRLKRMTITKITIKGSPIGFLRFALRHNEEKNLCHLHFFVVFVCCSAPLFYFASNICFWSIFSVFSRNLFTFIHFVGVWKLKQKKKKIIFKAFFFHKLWFFVESFSWKIAKCCFYVRLSVLQNLFPFMQEKKRFFAV